MAWKKWIFNWHKNWDVDGDTLWSGGLHGKAMFISEKPTLRWYAWAQMQTRLTGRESNHWEEVLESLADNQLHGAYLIRARGFMSFVVMAIDRGRTTNQQPLCRVWPSFPLPHTRNTVVPWLCGGEEHTGNSWCLEEAMAGGAKMLPAITRQIVPLPMFGTIAGLLVASLNSHTPLRVMLAQWRWLREEHCEWLRSAEFAVWGETQGVPSFQVTEEEITFPVCPFTSSLRFSAFLKCYFRAFSWFSRAFCTAALLPRVAVMLESKSPKSPLHSCEAQAFIKFLH